MHNETSPKHRSSPASHRWQHGKNANNLSVTEITDRIRLEEQTGSHTTKEVGRHAAQHAAIDESINSVNTDGASEAPEKTYSIKTVVDSFDHLHDSINSQFIGTDEPRPIVKYSIPEHFDAASAQLDNAFKEYPLPPAKTLNQSNEVFFA
jgi:hypothetical protein